MTTDRHLLRLWAKKTGNMAMYDVAPTFAENTASFALFMMYVQFRRLINATGIKNLLRKWMK